MHQALVLLALGLFGPAHVQVVPDPATAVTPPDGPVWLAGGNGNGNGNTGSNNGNGNQTNGNGNFGTGNGRGNGGGGTPRT